MRSRFLSTHLGSAAPLLLAASYVVSGALTDAAAAQTGAKTHHIANTRISRAATAPAAPRQLTITVLWDDAMTTHESGLWIGYLFARMEFVSHNGGRYNRIPGVVNPIFDEEVFARGEAAKIYRSLRAQGKGTDSSYFNDLDRVDSAGFMREYVWRYFHRDEWGTEPDTLRTNEFERWAKTNLASHAPITRGRLAFQNDSATGS